MPRPNDNGMPASAPNKRRLDDRFVRAVSVEDKRRSFWDTKQKGLVLTVTPAGRKSWRLYYRFGGRPRWFTIGDAERIDITTARSKARELDARMALDTDLDVQAELATRRKAGTFAELTERYMHEYAKPRLKAWQQTKKKIDGYLLPRWGKLQDINSVNLYSPLIQMLNGELTSRYVKRTTRLALFIAGASLIISMVALFVAATSPNRNPSASHSHIPAARYGAIWNR